MKFPGSFGLDYSYKFTSFWKKVKHVEYEVAPHVREFVKKRTVRSLKCLNEDYGVRNAIMITEEE